MATQKQVTYALSLLDKAGFSTRYMDRKFKALGATMRERSGTVENWLRAMNVPECSRLIDRLKAMQPYSAAADPEVQQLKADAGIDRETEELRRIAGLPAREKGGGTDAGR